MFDGDLTTKELAELSSAAVLMDRQWAPCRYNCPVHADVRLYVELIARGQWREAVDVIREHLPFASVCGRICHHPCETNCRRNDVDEPVAIREVKRFVCELQGAAGATVHKADMQDKARVAIIGAGPAGMSAGLELAKMGYRPTVFDKAHIAGGIPATAIPKYRLPRDVIRQDTDWICAHGVAVETGVEIGSNKTIADLVEDGFEAVLIATGLAKSRMLPLPGIEHKRVYPVLDFLTALAFDHEVEVGDDVLVIGGGNVAMDAARSAVRLGAKRVRAMCLEDTEEMPAWPWEQEEALEEGVSFIHRRGPVDIVVRDGTLKAVKTRKVLSVFDEQKRFAPTYDDADVTEIECDTVIMAIGQAPDWGFLEGSGLATDDRGRMVYNALTHQTSRPNVFACGEIVTPPGSAVEACAQGQRAAAAMDMYLRGQDIVIDDEIPPAIDKLPDDTADKVIKVSRCTVQAAPPTGRSKNFEQVDYNLAVETAMIESRRCMSCGAGAEVLIDKCAACLTCLRVCPFDIPVVTDVARIDSVLCQACGMCIAECPANAIVARGWDVKNLAEQTADALEQSKTIAYVCGHHATAEAWSGQDKIDGIAELYLPSMSRLSAAEILHTFEYGADRVIVVACEKDTDRYPNVTERIRKRIAQAREMLSEVGIDPACLQLIESANKDRETIKEAIAQAAESLKK